MSYNTRKKRKKMLDYTVKIWYFIDIQKINMRKGEMRNVK